MRKWPNAKIPCFDSGLTPRQGTENIGGSKLESIPVTVINRFII